MRDVTKLHPDLQKKIEELINLCEKNGIKIKVTECVRTKAEQDALYAKGRTTSGSIVTNCKGSSYSSMHQWGVAFDYIINQDTDGNGKIDVNDLYNAKLMNVVGKLGESIGLEWGGSWKSIVDKPHFQLPNWGSTASKLKATYGTPTKFMATWKTTKANTTSGITSYNKSLKKKFKTTTNLRMRTSADTSSKTNIVCTIPKGKTVSCNGRYITKNNSKWYFVEYDGKSGYCSSAYLK